MVFIVSSDHWLCVCLFTEAFSVSFALSLWSWTVKSNQRQWNDVLDVLVWSLLVRIHLTSDLKKLRIHLKSTESENKMRYHKTSQEFNLIWFSQKGLSSECGSINWLQPLDRQFMFMLFSLQLLYSAVCCLAQGTLVFISRAVSSPEAPEVLHLALPSLFGDLRKSGNAL